MPGPINVSGIIPPAISSDIIAIAATESGILQLARRQPMPTGVQQMPVQTSLPRATWVTAPGGRKSYSDLAFGIKTMTAEEVAVTVSIPQQYLDDSSINLWNFIRPQLGSAIATALDNAVVFGTDAPATFPAGGITDPAFCQATTAGTDSLDTVNKAMGAVEAQGLRNTGMAADISVLGGLRGVRDTSGAFLLTSPVATGAGAVSSLYGVPINFGQFPLGEVIDFITGNWQALIIGVRQDIRYDMSDQGVIADAAGKVVISAFQDDQVLMRAYARFGCLVILPPTQKFPNGAKPFASADMVANVTATGATAGSPGGFTPVGAAAPANVAGMAGLTASPATAWTSGQYVQTRTDGAAGRAYWNGTAWTAGVTP